MRQRWVDPALLAPAFVFLAHIDTSTGTGQRYDAWQVSEALRTAGGYK